jgi:glycosyltransferase involved in cell wall biosynthesis
MERGGMPPERVFVVRSGPSLERMKIVPPREHLKHGRRFLVGYVGVMGRQEGIDYLLRAVAHVVFDLKRTDVHFGLVGAGTSLEQMRAFAKELGVADYVTFTGRVSDAEMLDVLNTADVCVNPDVANEMNDISTMNKIMEYMALGRPIVSFDLVEARVSAGDAALYATANDELAFAQAIAGLLDDPERRAEMGRIGRERVTGELSWDTSRVELIGAYRTVLEPLGWPGPERSADIRSLSATGPSEGRKATDDDSEVVTAG